MLMLLLSWLQYATIFYSRDGGWIVLPTLDCFCRASEMCYAGMEYGVWSMEYFYAECDVLLVLRSNRAVKVNQNTEALWIALASCIVMAVLPVFTREPWQQC